VFAAGHGARGVQRLRHKYAKYVHNFVSFSFVVGLVLIVALWIKDNIPGRVDIDWVKHGGGFIKSKHAPAGRFNAGEKVGFSGLPWGPAIAVIVSGYLLLFPFYLTNIAGMQIAQVVHAVVAVLFVAGDSWPTSISAPSEWRVRSKRWAPARWILTGPRNTTICGSRNKLAKEGSAGPAGTRRRLPPAQ